MGAKFAKVCSDVTGRGQPPGPGSPELTFPMTLKVGLPAAPTESRVLVHVESFAAAQPIQAALLEAQQLARFSERIHEEGMMYGFFELPKNNNVTQHMSLMFSTGDTDEGEQGAITYLAENYGIVLHPRREGQALQVFSIRCEHCLLQFLRDVNERLSNPDLRFVSLASNVMQSWIPVLKECEHPVHPCGCEKCLERQWLKGPWEISESSIMTLPRALNLEKYGYAYAWFWFSNGLRLADLFGDPQNAVSKFEEKYRIVLHPQTNAIKTDVLIIDSKACFSHLLMDIVYALQAEGVKAHMVTADVSVVERWKPELVETRMIPQSLIEQGQPCSVSRFSTGGC